MLTNDNDCFGFVARMFYDLPGSFLANFLVFYLRQKQNSDSRRLFPQPHIGTSSCPCPNPPYQLRIMRAAEPLWRAMVLLQYIFAAEHYCWRYLLLLYCLNAPVVHATHRLLWVDRHSGIVLHGSTASELGILTHANYSNTRVHQYLLHIHVHISTGQTGLELTERNARPHRFPPSYLLTSTTIVDGERAQPMPSTLLLTVPYIALARGVLFHAVSCGNESPFKNSVHV